jgi:catechol 2,3-dioxygenase-like lactoylglutathione lyase family enzyme
MYPEAKPRTETPTEDVMTPRLTHIALHLRDLQASIDFYRDICGMTIVHEREDGGKRVVWMAEAGRENDFVFVLVPGGPGRDQADKDISHFGFALDSRAAVDRVAGVAGREGYLVWPPRQEPWPVGYYCAVKDPDGNLIEFSYGQPLGPGASDLDNKGLGKDAGDMTAKPLGADAAGTGSEGRDS